MTNYYGVKKIIELARELNFVNSYYPDVEKDEHLIGIVQCNDWVMAPDLTLKDNYNNFYKDYSEGIFAKMKLFVIKEKDIFKCPDKGRVLVRDLERW